MMPSGHLIVAPKEYVFSLDKLKQITEFGGIRIKG